jgi:hypothetical protein
MSDIVERLRSAAHTYDEYGVHSEIELEAADEIEKLRAVLEKLARLGAEPHYGNSVGNIIARAALGEKE